MTYQSTNSNKSNQELFAKYFQLYPDLISSRIVKESDHTWEKAIKKYYVGDFEESLRLFQIADPPEESMEDVRFYHALTHLSLCNSKEAINLFESIREGKYKKQIK